MITINVVGIPAPQGSMRGFVVGKKGGPQRAVVVAGGSKGGREKLGSWRQDVIDACQRYHDSAEFGEPLAVVGPAHVDLWFHLPRPKSAPKKRIWPMVKPDIDKLVRSTLDAMKLGGLYRDDSQVCALVAWKHYTDDQPGARIQIRELL